MRVRVKICGLRTEQDVEAAVEAGADAVGFVLADSPRRLELSEAAALAASVPSFVTAVAVLHHPPPECVEVALRQAACGVVQTEVDGLELQRLPRSCVLPVLHDGDDVEARLESLCAEMHPAPSAVVLEGAGRGGRGQVADWERAGRMARRTRLVLAGGLTPVNVARAIREVRPYGVDVCSGVEHAPGQKNPELMEEFVTSVRIAESYLSALALFDQ